MKRTVPCHCTTLRYAAQTLTEVYDQVLAPSGLKVTQYMLLESILEEETEQSITDLAHKLDVLREHCAAVGRDYDDIRKSVYYAFDTSKGADAILEDLSGLAALGFTLAIGMVSDVWSGLSTLSHGTSVSRPFLRR